VRGFIAAIWRLLREINRRVFYKRISISYLERIYEIEKAGL